MNLEYVTVFYLPLAFPALLAVLWLCLTVFPKHSREKRIVMGISGSAALVAGGVALIANIASYFQGNFLFFLTGPILALILGGLAGLISFLLILFLYYIPISLFRLIHKQTENAQTETDRPPLRYGRLIFAALLSFFLVAGGWFVAQEGTLKQLYGSPSEGAEEPLTTEQIREAYSNPIFRNHHFLIRGLLFRKNVPQDILEDIFRRVAPKDENVLSALLMNPNTPCALLQEAFETIASASRYPVPYTEYKERCL